MFPSERLREYAKTPNMIKRELKIDPVAMFLVRAEEQICSGYGALHFLNPYVNVKSLKIRSSVCVG